MKLLRLTYVFVLMSGLLMVLAVFCWGWLSVGAEIPNMLFSAVLGVLGTVCGAIIRNNGDGPPPGAAPLPAV